MSNIYEHITCIVYPRSPGTIFNLVFPLRLCLTRKDYQSSMFHFCRFLGKFFILTSFSTRPSSCGFWAQMFLNHPHHQQLYTNYQWFLGLYWNWQWAQTGCQVAAVPHVSATTVLRHHQVICQEFMSSVWVYKKVNKVVTVEFEEKKEKKHL